MTSSPDLGCAVAIVSHRRPRELRRLIGSLRPRFGSVVTQLIIIEDDGTPTEVDGATGDIVPCVHRVLTGRSFISSAKNMALAEVRRSFVAFIDDDNVVPPGALEHALELLRSNPAWGAVMPAAVYHRRPEIVWVYATPFRPSRWGHELIGRNRPREESLERAPLPTDALPNAAVFRTDALTAVGGWDEGLPVNSSADLCRRLKAARWEVWADPGARFEHDVETPDQRAFWAAHSADPARLYYEMHDWYLYQRRLHRGEAMFSVRAIFHASSFSATITLGLLMRGERAMFPLLSALVRGTLAGLRASARDPTNYVAP